MSNAGRRPRAIEDRKEDGENVLPVVMSSRGVVKPTDMSKLQKDLWDTIIPHVEVILQESDTATYRGMITALSRAVEADLLVNEQGMMIEQEVLNTRTGAVRKLMIVNPLVKTAQESWKLYNQFADRMGMSPSSRAKLGLLGAQALTAKEQLEKNLGKDPWAMTPDDLNVIEQEPINDEQTEQ